MIDTVAKLIRSADSVSLFCHTNPDGDAVGSMLALYFAIKKLGKDVRAYCDTPIPKRLKAFPGSEEISLPDKRVSSLSIGVDSADIDRLGLAKKSYLSSKTRVAIDHHGTFTNFGQYNVVEPAAAACSQIIFKLVDAMGLMDGKIAGLLFGGIVTDSGCFQFSNVTVETHEIACKLLSYGIDAAKIIYDVYTSTDISRFILKNRVLSKAQFFADGKIALIFFEKADFEETSTEPSDTEGIVSELIAINDVRLAISIAEVSERSYKVSLRSKDPVDCSELARSFGGGGHKNAAGCRLGGFAEDVKAKLVRLAETFV